MSLFVTFKENFYYLASCFPFREQNAKNENVCINQKDMTGADIEKKLREIESHEFCSVGSFPGSKTRSLEERIRHYLWICEDGRYSLFDDLETKNRIDVQWGNLPRGVPVLRQLLIDPHIIIDLKPFVSIEAFVKEYGLTPSQLYELALDGFVVFNLYTLNKGLADSYDVNDFGLYIRSCKSVPGYRKLFETGRCRINTIRKTAFFNDILDDRNSCFQELQEEGVRIFSPGLKLLDDRCLRSIGYPENDKNSALIVAAHHYAYNKALLLAEKDRVMERLHDHIVSQIQRHASAEEVMEGLKWLRGIKNIVSAKYTASMGGIYNMSPGDFKDYSLIPSGPLSFPQRVYETEKNVVTAVQELVENSHIGKLLQKDRAAIDDSFLKLYDFGEKQPGMSDREFRNVRYFLKEHASLVREAAGLVELLSGAEEFKDRIRCGDDIVRLQTELIKEAGKYGSVGRFINRWNNYSNIPFGFGGLIPEGIIKNGIVLLGLFVSGIVSYVKPKTLEKIKIENNLKGVKLRIYQSIETLTGKSRE